MTSYEQYKALEITIPHQQIPHLDKVHIGMVLLGTEHSLEYEWSKLLGDEVLTFSSRLAHNGDFTIDKLKQISTQISEVSDNIAIGLPMDVMLFACTSASIVIGEDKVTQLLTKYRGNIPATNPWTAAKSAFHHLNAKRIAVLSPYPSNINYFLYQQLIDAGFNVEAIGSFGIDNDIYVTTISKESYMLAIDKILSQSNPDLIFISCTNVRILDHLQMFEDEAGIPIVSSNTALFWHAMHLAGKHVQRPGFGKLLSGL